MPDRPTYNLHASLGYQLTLVARLQARRFEDSLRPLGLTRITWCVLLAIGNEGLSQPSDIAAFVGIDRSEAQSLQHIHILADFISGAFFAIIAKRFVKQGFNKGRVDLDERNDAGQWWFRKCDGDKWR